MNISQLVIFIMVISAIATGITMFYSDLAANYGITINENQSLSVINRTNDITTFTSNVTSTLESGGGLLQQVYFSVGLIWGVIAQILLLPTILVGMITDMLSFVPFVPGWFVVLITGIPVAIIIFKLVSWFTNRET